MSYQLLLFVHVSCAVVWVGTVFFAQAVAWRVIRARDVAAVGRVARQSEGISKGVGAAVVLLVVAGILLVEKLGISYTTTWVLIGICAYVSSILLGGVTARRIGTRVDALVAAWGVDSAEVARAVRALWTVARIDLVVLAVAICATTWKPGT